MSAIILRKFNMNYISEDDLIFVVGAPKSGKSHITKDLLYYHNTIPYGCVISNTHCNKSIYDYIPEIFIYDKYDASFIKRVVKKQIKNADNTIIDSRSFLIFEDALNYTHLKKSKYLRKLFSSHQLLNTLCILEIIELSNIYEILLNKNKVNYLFILKDNFQNNRKKLYDIIKEKLNIPFTLFCKFLDDYTDNYNCLVFDLQINSKYIEDKLFWYKSSCHDGFRIGGDQLWQYNRSHFVGLPEKDINNNLFLRSINQF